MDDLLSLSLFKEKEDGAKGILVGDSFLSELSLLNESTIFSSTFSLISFFYFETTSFSLSLSPSIFRIRAMYSWLGSFGFVIALE